MPNKFLRVLGFVVVGWLLFAYIVGFFLDFPVSAYIEASMMIMIGVSLFLFVFYTDISANLYFNVICISSLLQCLIALCQWFWVDPVSITLSHIIHVTSSGFDTRTPVGILGNRNFLGAYLAISLPFFLRNKWCWFIPVIAFGLWITQTATAIIAAIIGITFFFYGFWGILVGVVLGAIYLFGLSGKDLAGNVRLEYWKDAIQKVSASPISLLFGYGQGVTWKIGNQLHSEYVATLFNYGLIGLSSMVAYIVTVYRGHKILLASFIILCINMTGNHPLHVVSTAILAIVIIALIEREKLENVKTKI